MDVEAPKGRKRILLRPANPDFEPLTISSTAAESVRVLAEVVEILGT